MRFCSAGSGSPLCVLGAFFGYLALAGSLRVCAFICGLLLRRLPSIGARRCGSVAALCPRFTPAVYPATNRTACDILRSYSAGRDRLCAFSGRFSVICLGWFTSSLCVYSRAIAAALAFDRRSAMRFCCGFAFGSRLLFVLRQTGRLAAACVSVPPGRDRHLCVLAVLFDYLPLWVHFGFGRFLQAISTGYRGCGGRGNGVTGLAARPLCVFAQSHWLCNAFRGEYAGATRPRLRQRVFDSLDSPQGQAE